MNFSTNIEIRVQIIAVQIYFYKMTYSMNALLLANAFKKENMLILSYHEIYISAKNIVQHKHY